MVARRLQEGLLRQHGCQRSSKVREGDWARERYRLTSSVPALRERLSRARHQSLFPRYIADWDATSDRLDSCTPSAWPERWSSPTTGCSAGRLRHECEDPRIEIDAALWFRRERPITRQRTQ